MIYYNVNDIVIRDMVETDPEIITHEEHLQGWTDQKVEKYTRRLKDVAEGKCVALVAEYQGNVAGYFNVYPNSMGGSFGGKGLPELVDFGVLAKYRSLCNPFAERDTQYSLLKVVILERAGAVKDKMVRSGIWVHYEITLLEQLVVVHIKHFFAISRIVLTFATQ